MNKVGKSAEIALPSCVTFEVPGDFARYCGGHPVRVRAATVLDRGLHIEWDESVVSFTSQGVAVDFALDALLGMLVNPSEEISGMEACTLRIGVVDDNGKKGSLPILSANPRARSEFLSVAAAISALSLPLKMYTSAKDMLTS